jgi:hypothetical protein
MKMAWIMLTKRIDKAIAYFKKNDVMKYGWRGKAYRRRSSRDLWQGAPHGGE